MTSAKCTVSVPIVFVADDSIGHYDIPLQISPYGYSTYRGIQIKNRCLSIGLHKLKYPDKLNVQPTIKFYLIFHFQLNCGQSSFSCIYRKL
ncbi:hypothetical protein E0H90_03755 [Acinetobacter sp. ANC 3791]|nr:hypothetical protein E0H90_03755 [Acinetobacter sp. ANC 3791]